MIEEDKDMKMIFCDVETSGFSVVKDRILDIGIIYEKNGIKLDEFQIYIKLDEYPEGHEKAQAVHNITPQFLEVHGVSEEEAFKQLLGFLDKHINKFDKKDKAIFGGHNSSFDVRHVEALFKRQGNNFFYSYFTKESLDVLKMCREANKNGLINTENNKLGTIAEYLDVDLGNAHSALDDIIATREIFKKLQMLEEDRKEQGYI